MRTGAEASQGEAERIDRWTLLNAVYAATQSVKWPECSRPHAEIGEPVLRTLLTYCYAAGILGSEEIAAACFEDSAVRYICANDFPSSHTIRDFRRRNLPWIRQSLREVFILSHPSMSTVQACLEAEQRLRRAMQTDSIALDA